MNSDSERIATIARINAYELTIADLQAKVAELRASLEVPRKKIGPPHKQLPDAEYLAKVLPKQKKQQLAKIAAERRTSAQITGGKSWQGMTDEQRSAEMMRRRLVSQGKAPSKNRRPYQRKLIAQKQAKVNGAVVAA